MHVIDLLHHRENILALWEQGQVTNEHEITHPTANGTQYCRRSHGLQYHVDKPYGYILPGGIALGVGKERCRGIHWKTRHRLGGNIADEKVDVRDVPLQSQGRYLLDIIGLEKQAR